MDLFNEKALENARKEHIRLLNEQMKLKHQIAALKDESGIAREAVRMFCSPELEGVAMNWLRGKGLCV